MKNLGRFVFIFDLIINRPSGTNDNQIVKHTCMKSSLGNHIRKSWQDYSVSKYGFVEMQNICGTSNIIDISFSIVLREFT